MNLTLSDGGTIIVNEPARTITAAPLTPGHPPAALHRLIATIAGDLMNSGALIGPQVDEFTGIAGDWDDPRAPLFAVRDAAAMVHLHIT